MAEATTTTEPTTTSTPTVDQEVVQARREAAKCRDAFEPFLEQLQRVDSRLSVGLVQSDFNTALGDVRIEYDQVPFGKLEPDCLVDVGVPLENAFRQYAQSNTKWANCIDMLSCEVEGAVLSELQGLWADASKSIGKGEAGLRQLAQP